MKMTKTSYWRNREASELLMIDALWERCEKQRRQIMCIPIDKIKKVLIFILASIIYMAIAFGLMLWGLSPEQWYAGNPNYKQLVELAKHDK